MLKGSSGPIWPKFELMQVIMHVYVTSTFKKDWINTNGGKVETLMSLKGS